MKPKFKFGDLVIGIDEDGCMLGRIKEGPEDGVGGFLYYFSDDSCCLFGYPFQAFFEYEIFKVNKTNQKKITNIIASSICKVLE